MHLSILIGGEPNRRGKRGETRSGSAAQELGGGGVKFKTAAEM